MTRSPRSRAAAVVPGLLLLVALAACGSPSDASKDDFCKDATAGNANTDLYDAIEAKDWTKAESLYHDQASALDDVGTPEGISDKAREGFKVNVDALKDISADEVSKALADGVDVVREQIKSEDLKNFEAYQKYVILTCAQTQG
ncbi:MAG: hypothetical protein L0H31_12955 [Nocardioidaceae bacterium]|nr:hypothetical protein [Nocardioidaceae bacterium]